ncbi:MAG: hypothetical protein A2Y78_14640 [Acidobacteria bacterium RBG_13_68_16]|nr:MAG: hypothetical protein A2Y78_14640 [Acidobacteria bacterium RBG_13_68_16]
MEYFLGEYLRSHNPNPGDLSAGRLSFAQKLSLLDRNDPTVSFLIPGIRRLNAVRNRLAHTYRAIVSNDDAAVFLSVSLFWHLRLALAAPAMPNDDPLDILEEFARHAGIALASAGDRLSMLCEMALAPPLHLI